MYYNVVLVTIDIIWYKIYCNLHEYGNLKEKCYLIRTLSLGLIF